MTNERATDAEALIRRAFIDGATAVHDEWKSDPDDWTRGDPDFAEAAGDYARDAVERLSAPPTGDVVEAVARLVATACYRDGRPVPQVEPVWSLFREDAERILATLHRG